MYNPSQKLTVTAIMDENLNVVTAFFNELPGLMVQGKSESDVRVKLNSLLQSYSKRQQSTRKKS